MIEWVKNIKNISLITLLVTTIGLITWIINLNSNITIIKAKYEELKDQKLDEAKTRFLIDLGLGEMRSSTIQDLQSRVKYLEQLQMNH